MSFQRQAPNCEDTIDHPDTCMCAVRKYPWHTQDGIILEKRGPQGTQITTQFTRTTYDKCVKRLTKGKAPGPDNIPNDIIKTLPPQCHDLMYLFFQHCYKQREIPTQWKHSKTILLHKKDDPTQLANYRPIALANTIYKLYTSTITSLLTSYGEQHRLLHFSQEGFRPQRNTSRQIQMILASLEDARLTNKDIYITYIDFKNAFGSIDHARLLALMEDLGYPTDAIEIIGNIYKDSTTSFTGSHFGTTPPINISRGTIQGDTLSPYLFIIFLEPLLRWLEKDNKGYHFSTSLSSCTTSAYADDLAILSDTIHNIQPQITKLQKFAEWAHMDLNLAKCAITGCPNRSKLKPNTFKAFIQSQQITYKNKNFPTLTQNEPYTYLGIQLIPSLKWNLQKEITLKKAKQQGQLLAQSPASLKQKIHILNTVIKPRIAYAYYAVPFSKPDIKKLDKIISKITKETCRIPRSTANILTHLSHENFGINATSLLPDYIHCIGQQLLQALNDQGQLGTIYQGLTKYITAKYGSSLHLPKLKQQACSRSPITRTLFLLNKEYEIHITTASKAFPIKQTQLELAWKSTPAYVSFTAESKIQSQKFLDKLYIYGITTISQIQNTTTKAILTPEEFRTIYKHAPKTIKAALQQAQILFPNLQIQTPQRTIQPPTSTNQTHTQQLDPPLGQAIHKIIKEKTTTRKDKWGAQAINKSYLCLWQNANTIIQQWRNEEDLLHPDNILFDHNLLTITQYNNTLLEQATTKTYANYLTHAQTKDKKFIQPPLKITNLTTSTHECNPDKDILVNKPTIQVNTSVANIYDHNGNYIASINLDRL